MKLASYKATRAGWQGWFNRLIRLRFSGPHSHSEIVFEPGDGVDALMPDGTCEMTEAGELWCASSVAIERLPNWGYRAGKVGGVRFKRIALDPGKWDLRPLRRDAQFAAEYFKTNEGVPYSWRLIAKFIAWCVDLRGTKQLTCSQVCAGACGVPPAEAWRLDPCTLDVVVQVM
ncbi:MAG: hypothetical protein V4451_04735 [Pseudomonadota bacterium]